MITVLTQTLCLHDERSLIQYSTLDIIECRLPQPIARLFLIIQLVVDHRTVKGSKGILMRPVSHITELFVADVECILILAAGTQHIHLQMQKFLASLLRCHQDRITIEILFVEIALAQMFQLCKAA